MKKSIEDLVALDPLTLRDIKCLVSSIYKVNKSHHLFIKLRDEFEILDDAEYIVYPNINGNQASKFLDSNGNEILHYIKNVSEFIFLPSNLEINKHSISLDRQYFGRIDQKDVLKSNSFSNSSF